MACPNEDALLLAMTEGRESEFLEHVSTCDRCNKIVSLADMLSTHEVAANTDAAVARLLARVENEKSANRIAIPKWLGFAAAAGIGLVSVLLWRGDNAEFRARGTPVQRSLERDVGVTFRSLENVDRPLADGEMVSRNHRFLISHRNVGPSDVYALIFAVDSKGAVHWMYPAHESEDSNATSITLASTVTEVPQADSVEFEDLPAGELHLYSVVTEKPAHVNDVEALPRVDQSSLKARFDDALVVSISAKVVNK